LKNKLNLLFITYYFPPLGGGGVQRTLKFIKYLNKNKYNICVLTVKTNFIRYTKDYSLLMDIPENIKVYRCFYPDINWFYSLLYKLNLTKIVKFIEKHFMIPDNKRFLFNFSKNKLNNIITNNKIDTVYISAPPFSLYRFAIYIKLHYKIKIITDFRDFWTDNFDMINKNISKKRMNIESYYEKILIYSSDYIITATDYMNKVIKDKYILRNIKTITNGYDKDDFKNINFRKKNTGILNFSYTGSIYGHQIPNNLFEAIYNFTKNGLYPNVMFSFYGNIEKNSIDINNKAKIFIRFNKYLEHNKIINILKNSNILILYIGGYNKNNIGILTGKLFEYLYSNKHILFIGPTGEASNIIKKCKAGFIVSDNHKEITNILKIIYNKWENYNLNMNSNIREISKYDRKILTKTLENILDNIL